MTDIAAVIFIHFLFCLTLCASNVDENFQINFCDVRPNCDGDSELFEKLIEYVPADSLQGNHSDNDILMHYPVKRTKRSFAPYRTGKAVASQATNTLDNLLLHSDYDKRIRPQVI